jgi:hypothetical protein
VANKCDAPGADGSTAKLCGLLRALDAAAGGRVRVLRASALEGSGARELLEWLVQAARGGVGAAKRAAGGSGAFAGLQEVPALAQPAAAAQPSLEQACSAGQEPEPGPGVEPSSRPAAEPGPGKALPVAPQAELSLEPAQQLQLAVQSPQRPEPPGPRRLAWCADGNEEPAAA